MDLECKFGIIVNENGGGGGGDWGYVRFLLERGWRGWRGFICYGGSLLDAVSTFRQTNGGLMGCDVNVPYPTSSSNLTGRVLSPRLMVW